MVTVAGVSLPLARGSAAWATVSVMRSPTTTTRVMSSPPWSRGWSAKRCPKRQAVWC